MHKWKSHKTKDLLIKQKANQGEYLSQNINKKCRQTPVQHQQSFPNQNRRISKEKWMKAMPIHFSKENIFQGVKSGKGLDENFVTPRKALGNLNKENQGLKAFGLKQNSANPLKPLKLADNTNLVTPRKALGNINKDPRAASIKTPSLKPSLNQGSGKPGNLKVKCCTTRSDKLKSIHLKYPHCGITLIRAGKFGLWAFCLFRGM